MCRWKVLLLASLATMALLATACAIAALLLLAGNAGDVQALVRCICKLTTQIAGSASLPAGRPLRRVLSVHAPHAGRDCHIQLPPELNSVVLAGPHQREMRQPGCASVRPARQGWGPWA